MSKTTDDHGGESRRKGKAPGNNVIHVTFGRGGGRVPGMPDGLGLSTGEDPHGGVTADGMSAAPGEPVTDLFSKREVAKLLGLPETRLRSLARAGIVTPSGSRSGKRAYTFQDLIALRATRDLLEHRVKLRDVARVLGALRRTLPRVTRPLQELRIVSDGQKVIVRSEAGAFEPISGQMVLDFQVTALREDVVRVLRPATREARARTAYELYCRASSLDENPATFDEAEALYRRALELDPQLAIALTNLGNIRFRRGDDAGAQGLYERALALDDAQPEAHYNLGYVMLERGEATGAIPHFEKAIAADPRFSDAHFNLAMAYEQAGQAASARPYWARYLELEPEGTWSDIARQHLKR